MKTWNIGIAGAGLIADTHALAIKNLPNARVSGFCDNGSGKAKKLAQKYDCQAFANSHKLIEDKETDIIIIASPSGAHLEPTIYAAQNGKHVLCEKPLEISTQRVDKMIAAHEQAGTRLGGIFNFRYDAPVRFIEDTIGEGRLGTITYAAVHVPWWRKQEYYNDNWHGTLALDGGGAFMNQSIHMIDLLQHLMGKITHVMAYTHNLGHPRIEVEDTGAAIVRFESKAIGTIYGTTASFPGRHRKLEITGTHGTIEMVEDNLTCWQFSEEQSQDKNIRDRFNKVNSGGGVSDPAAINYENHKNNIADFIDAIENKRPFAISGEEARKAVAIIEGVYESAKTRKEVVLGR